MKGNKYSKTLKGIVTQIYKDQITSSKKRGHPPPEYTKIELRDAMLDTPLFYKLHDAWVCSNYNSNLKPSIDRTNCYLPYTKDNIKLMTWKENRDKGLTEKLENRGSGWGKGSPLVKVNQLDKCGSFIVKFNSIKEAAISINKCHSNIVKVCQGKQKSAGGFLWEYADA